MDLNCHRLAIWHSICRNLPAAGAGQKISTLPPASKDKLNYRDADN